MLLRRFSVVLALAAVGIASAAQAVPITYTFTGLATGSLNSVGFANAAFTFTLTGDTVNVSFPFGPDTPIVPTTGVGSIAGFPNFTFTEPIRVFNNQSGQTAGINRNNSFDLLNLSSAAFATWDAISDIGPITDTPPDFVAGNPTSTSAGDLILSSAPTATLVADAAASAVGAPEPGTLALLGAGLGVVGLIARRRAK